MLLKECLDSLISLFQWAWSTFCTLGIRLSSEELTTSLSQPSLSSSSPPLVMTNITSSSSPQISTMTPQPPKQSMVLSSQSTVTCLKSFHPKVFSLPLKKSSSSVLPPHKPDSSSSSSSSHTSSFSPSNHQQPSTQLFTLERKMIVEELKRLVFVCNTSLYLLTTYLHLLYPSDGQLFCDCILILLFLDSLNNLIEMIL